MKRPLIMTAAVIAALLAVAGALRLSERPYIVYAEGRRADAMDGLRAKAEHGDPLATFLVATNYERGVLGTPDMRQASDWYVRAARMGDVRSISRYIDLNVRDAQNAEQCRKAIAMLDLAGRSGDVGSLAMLGRYYESGFCTPIDLVRAARYYIANARTDRQRNVAVEAVVARLDPEQARGLQPLPEKFDVAQDQALRQFLAALPLGATNTTP